MCEATWAQAGKLFDEKQYDPGWIVEELYRAAVVLVGFEGAGRCLRFVGRPA